MAGIVNGIWSQSHDVPLANATSFNNWVTTTGEAGPSGSAGYDMESDRYHYYFAKGCPNCHRVVIALSILDISDIFSSSFVANVKRNDGWRINTGDDPIFSADSVQDVIVAAEGAITSKCTVPLLVDKKQRKVVSDQSDDMIRMMDTLAAQRAGTCSKLWPPEHRSEIDKLNNHIRMRVSSGMYEILFASTASKKRAENRRVIHALQYLDHRLAKLRFLAGSTITACDVWLFPTLLRVDSVYSEIFGLTAKVSDFSNIARYLQEIWGEDHFQAASDLTPIEEHYFKSIIHSSNGFFEPGLGKKPDQLKRFKCNLGGDVI